MTMFNYDDSWNQEIDKSLGWLTRSNNGIFKSEAQKNYFHKQAKNALDPDVALAKLRGITLLDGQTFIDVNAYVRWADYGSKSYRRVGWVYVLDDFGVVAKYKLKFEYKGNWSGIVPEKTEMIWFRPYGAVLPVWDTPVKEEVVTTHLGEVGDKIEVTGKVTRISEYSKVPMGHWDTSYGYKTEIQVGTATLIYWGRAMVKLPSGELKGAEEGITVKVKATVKALGEYKGKKQTTISRPKFSINEEEVVA